MDFENLFDDMLGCADGTASVCGSLDFHSELQKWAFRCALGLVPIQDAWSYMLSSILNNWKVYIRMSLDEAVYYMMNVCGYSIFGEEIIASENSEFWFLYSEKYKTLHTDESKGIRLYYLTIAIFESINYWCWHDAPVQITFDFEGLKDVLRYGDIQIDWDSYLG